MRVLQWAVVLAGLAGLLWLSRPWMSDPQTAGEGVRPAPTSDVEQWVADAARAGGGVVRQVVQDCDTSTPQVLEERVESLGRLSEQGERQLAATIDADLTDFARELEALGDDPSKERRRILIWIKYAERLLVRESLAAGRYLTLPERSFTPPTPPGAKGIIVSPYHLRGDTYCKVFFAIDRRNHEGLRRLHAEYRERTEQEQLALRSEFNARPHEARRAWVERFAELEARVSIGATAGLSSTELVEYATMSGELRAAGAFCEAWSPIWRPLSDRAAPKAK